MVRNEAPMRDKLKLNIKEIVLPLLAALVYAINMKSFVNAGNLLPGGLSGLSVLLCRLAEKYTKFRLNYSVLYIILNIPGTYLIWKYVSKRFCLVSLIDIVMTSVLVEMLPEIPVTNDILLVCVFGGIFAGVSELLMLISGGCGGGTSFWSIYLSKIKGRSMWNTVLGFNVVLLCITGLFFNWESALYSIIFQFVTTQVVNMFDNRFKRATFIIITSKPDEIIDAVYRYQNHSVTKLSGIGSYSHEEKSVLYTVVGKYEEKQLIELVLEIDPHAFVNITASEKVVGNFNQLPY